MIPQIHAIIPAGGAGSRLWPLSRQAEPKFLLDPLGRGQSLLQETFARLKEVSLTITVVTGQAHYDEVCRQLPELTGESEDAFPGEILVEPSPRDSMAAIGFAAYVIRERYGDAAIVGSFAADHVIKNSAAFENAVNAAVTGAKRGLLTTLGIVPDEPSTAFGYISAGKEEIAPHLYPVEAFVEKPNQNEALRYVEQGYLWNAGIFIVQTGVLAAALAEELPAMDTQLSALAKRHLNQLIDEGEASAPRRKHWDRLTKIAIDYALAEPLAARGEVAVVRTDATLGWSDIGDFQAVQKLRSGNQDDGGNLLLTLAGKEVRILGLENVGVVDTPDALLVLNLDDAQRVKDVVDDLKKSGKTTLL